MALLWLAVMALVFYGLWNPRDVLVLCGSVIANFLIAHMIARKSGAARSRCLILGVIANLSLLGYFKYWGFLTENLSYLPGVDLSAEAVLLPLAISFFTFTQIAYLVDLHRDHSKPYGLLEYASFVLFFPHLIAGPIIYHASTIPQFQKPRAFRFRSFNVAVGLSVFVIGLAKKVLIADTMAQFATPMFDGAAAGVAPDLFSAWGGTLAYSFQLYFDFSGYSDMAIGIAFMLGIRLPINFFSPYKASSIIDFWRRWHISLSRFVRDYIYTPMGGNRQGDGRRTVNVLLTMLLMGFWHGAGWTFLLWGGLHGIFIVVNHAWRALTASWRTEGRRNVFGPVVARSLTFLAVILAWVLFRAETLEAAALVYRGLAGMNGMVVPESIVTMLWLEDFAALTGATVSETGGQHFAWQWAMILCLLVFVNLAPNSMEVFARAKPALTGLLGSAPTEGVQTPLLSGTAALVWSPRASWVIVISALTLFVFWQLLLGTGPREFIYFRF